MGRTICASLEALVQPLCIVNLERQLKSQKENAKSNHVISTRSSPRNAEWLSKGAGASCSKGSRFVILKASSLQKLLVRHGPSRSPSQRFVVGELFVLFC